jgi:hypothetical protein
MTSFVAKMLAKCKRHGVDVPSMDGALKPNNVLEEAVVKAELDAPDNVTLWKGRMVVTSGRDLIELCDHDRRGKRLQSFDAEISCMCTLADGSIVVGLADGSIQLVGGQFDGAKYKKVNETDIHCPTSLCAVGSDCVLLTIGSSQHGPGQWNRDLMSLGCSGSVWRIHVANGTAVRVSDKLAYPCGVMQTQSGRIVVSEAWKHRLIEIGPNGACSALLDELPGYPSRITPTTSNDGYWLCVFAPRRSVVELILQDDKFRAEMINGIDEKYWMAPALATGHSFKEPLLGGAVKQLGHTKPWAPTRSYGLLIKLGLDFHPVASFHSRGDGTRHGVTSCIEADGQIVVTSKGGNSVLAVDLGPTSGSRSASRVGA